MAVVEDLALFEVSKRVIKALPSSFLKATPHDADDWEHPDRLWIEWTPDSDVCEGQYISVGKLTQDGCLWCAESATADRFGGHPTLWDVSGTESEVAQAVINHLKESREK